MRMARVPKVFRFDKDGGGAVVTVRMNGNKSDRNKVKRPKAMTMCTLPSDSIVSVSEDFESHSEILLCSRPSGSIGRPLAILRMKIFIGIIGLFIMQIAAVSAATTQGGDIKVEVKVPKEAEMGSSVELRCDWRILGGKGLYSVKWYKDEHEFFRYMPDNDPMIQTFSQPGVNLDRRSNNEKSIHLRDLTLGSSGQYKCEVSTEAPSFDINFETANLTVIALPERGPEITGLSSHYAAGENITANCEAWPSVPKATLRWTINDEEVPTEKTVLHGPLKAVGAGMPSMLGLRFEAEPRHFEGGKGIVRIKCIAQVGTRVFQVEKRIPMAHVNNQRLSAGDLMRSPASGRSVHFLLAFPIILPTLLLSLFTT